MNKNIKLILTAAATVLTMGCAHAGTWVNGYYIDGPLCTVCDGMRIVQHAYGTTVCAHCDGTGIEPPEETVVANTVVVDAWCPLPPPPRYHHNHHPYVHRNPPPPRRTGPAAARHPAPRHAARPAARPAAPRGGARPPAPRGGGHAGGRGRR